MINVSSWHGGGRKEIDDVLELLGEKIQDLKRRGKGDDVVLQ
jgi:hypothetical protein